MRYLLLLTTILGVVGCDAEDSPQLVVDTNKDGQVDVWYEVTEDGFFEFVDKNLDGSVDESTKFGIKDEPIQGRSDDDFNGILETLYKYENFVLSNVYVDSDEDGLIDAVLEYKFGILDKATRFVFEHSSIESISFRYGLPDSPNVLDEDSNTIEFDQRFCDAFCEENRLK